MAAPLTAVTAPGGAGSPCHPTGFASMRLASGGTRHRPRGHDLQCRRNACCPGRQGCTCCASARCSPPSMTNLLSTQREMTELPDAVLASPAPAWHGAARDRTRRRGRGAHLATALAHGAHPLRSAVSRSDERSTRLNSSHLGISY